MKKRRATIIIETEKGIMLTKMHERNRWLLPGGHAEKGLSRLLEANDILQKMNYSGAENVADLDVKINNLIDAAYEDMDDDFNTPNALAKVFGLVSEIQKIHNNQQSINEISKLTFDRLKNDFTQLVFDIFGLKDELNDMSKGDEKLLDGLMNIILDYRKEARTNKDWKKSDEIRDTLAAMGIQIKDGKEGATWSKIS